MALKVQIHGGPRDGEYIDYMGPFMRMPVPRPLYAHYTAGDALPLTDTFLIEEYELRRGFDGEMYYVRRPRAS